MHETGFRFAIGRGCSEKDFAKKGPQRAEPSGFGVHDLYKAAEESGISEPSWILVLPFGTAAPGLTFRMRVWAWKGVEGQSIYTPYPLGIAEVVLGEASAGDLSRGAYMADSVVVDGPPDAITSFEGQLRVHATGARWIEFDFARNCRPPAEKANALWQLFEP